MPRFRVKEGKHAQDGHVYKKGEVVDSHLDLIKLFPEKFEVVSSPDPVIPPEDDEDEDPAPPPKKTAPTKTKKRAAVEEAFDDD